MYYVSNYPFDNGYLNKGNDLLKKQMNLNDAIAYCNSHIYCESFCFKTNIKFLDNNPDAVTTCWFKRSSNSNTFHYDNDWWTYRKLNTIPIYYINLDRCQDRNKRFLQNISTTNDLMSNHNYQLKINRIQAIDGENLDQFEKTFTNSNEILQKIFEENLLIGEISCTCSHLIAIKQAFMDSNDYAIIAEDDVDLTYLAMFFDYFKLLLECVPDDMEIIQLVKGQDPSDNIKVYPFDSWKIKYWSACVYFINKKGMKKICEKFFQKDYILFDENLINCDKKFVADILIFQNVITYSSYIPFALWQCCESTLHPSHLQYQQLARNNVLSIIENTHKINYLKNQWKFNKKHFEVNGKYLIFTSAGDHSNFVQYKWLSGISDKVDLVVYYYGKSLKILKKYKNISNLAIQSEGNKFDNLFKFYHTYQDSLQKYQYVAVLDDDIIFKNYNSSKNPIQVIFDICDLLNPKVAGPSCITDCNFSDMSWWKQTHQIKGAKYHFTNFIETGTPFFRIDSLNILMTFYHYKKIPSWGSDLWYIQMLGSESKKNFLIIDEVGYINPTIEYKQIQKREINTYDSEKNEKKKWLEYSKEYGFKNTLPFNIIYEIVLL